ncbi:hypothetical protein [uncultured Duncaniella sp.]|uniref:hypothetical protein n=1 Tax=uncultured Duncaniella sp. TaxID=2768039 RepID=UPI0025CBA1BB|nr:hypothetical protein [uncultured Duncaniella sp.]
MKRYYTVAIGIAISSFNIFASSAIIENPNSQLQTPQTEADSLRHEIALLKAEKEQNNLQLAQIAKDNKLKSIWGRPKSFSIGYINTTLDQSSVGLPDRDARFGAFFSFAKTFYLHKKPIANLIKIGLDLNFEVNYVNYEKGHNFSEGPDFNWDWRPGQDNEPIDYSNSYLGTHQIDLGIGLGPSVTIAPFSFLSGSINNLKASFYYHFTPSLSSLLFSESDDLKQSWAFNLYRSYGVKLSYKKLSLGIEHRNGEAKYKAMPIAYYEYKEESGNHYYEDEGYWYGTAKEGDKVKYKISEFRAYIGINF